MLKIPLFAALMKKAQLKKDRGKLARRHVNLPPNWRVSIMNSFQSNGALISAEDIFNVEFNSYDGCINWKSLDDSVCGAGCHFPKRIFENAEASCSSFSLH